MRFFPTIYDWIMTPAEWSRIGRWRRAVVAPARGRLLEIGAGTGLDFAHYNRDAWVVATDADVSMLECAGDRARRAEATIVLVAADARLLPFRDATFSGAVTGLAMRTIARPERALAELRRTIQDGGLLRMLEHVRVDRPAIVGRIQDWVTPIWRSIAGGCHLNRRTVGAVRAAGFAPVLTRSHWGGFVQAIVAANPAADTHTEGAVTTERWAAREAAPPGTRRYGPLSR